ncbi:MAG: alanine racemase, partial [Chitinophagaceae bacterium]
DEASIHNSITCIATLLALGYSSNFIQEQIRKLSAVEMRLQLKMGINNCVIINDSYSNDISSLNIALQYLQQQAGLKPATVVLSDLLQTGMADDSLYEQVAILLHQYGVKKLIGIGKKMQAFASVLQKWIPNSQFYTTTDDFLQLAVQHSFQNECILLKGARTFEFEKINIRLSWQLHQTVMEVNLTAMVHNLNLFKKQLLPSTKLMAMVKAFSYGSGTLEVAQLLQFHKVDYLAVAYADEGIALRKGGIHLPIMVMNAENSAFDALIQYQLEPEIYSFQIYNEFHQYLLSQGIQQFPVHIKLNTGMNRLGFEVTELAELANLLNNQQTMVVQSAFSHLVASENTELDEFTQQQATLFEKAVGNFENQIGYKVIKHISNSAGITRHNQFQYNMVRLGIGLYGIKSATKDNMPLEVVATLKTTIAQIRQVSAGQTVGYNRRGLVKHDSRIATLRIGYADGFNRLLGNGNAYVLIRGKKAFTIGAVCMDMVMVDITHIPEAEVNDEVEIFGKQIPIQQVAEWCKTIAYEVITTIGQRVKRIYFEE